MSRLTIPVELAWQIAASEAAGAGHAEIGPSHLLVGLLSLEKALRAKGDARTLPAAAIASIREERAALTEILSGASLDAGELRRALRRRAGRGSGPRPERMGRSAASKAAFERAAASADGLITGPGLVAALLESPDDVIRDVLAERRVTVEELLRRARALSPAAENPTPMRPLPAVDPESKTPTLDAYSRDLTRLARRGELGPVIGRRGEILQVLQTLARRSKNNPVLVGAAGVGKTAVVEALAIRAAVGKDPEVLGGKRIVELNLGALLGGTEYRGEFEKRLNRILEEARADESLILFIDEIHTVVGAGRAGGGGTDAANILKPALARGELVVIGATTLEEYRRHIEKDPALERRFDRIELGEPSAEETLEILRGLRTKWESHHGVTIEDAALDAAVKLSVRFDSEHRLPDKAVDLVDKASARARIPKLSMLPPAASGASAGGSAEAARERVGPRLVAEVLAEKRGIGLDLVTAELGERSGARLLAIEAFLKSRLVGQDAAIERVAGRLRLAQAGLAERRGPLAVFLLLGPTGVGKTELARLLAEGLFGGADEMVRFDMSEYMEEHAVAKLLGSPPGYVGHEEEGLLIQGLRRRPHAVVLLDEVEKAHPRLFDVFLQVFDEGRVTGAAGRVADARNAIFVMTSNLGSAARPRPGYPAPASGPAPAEAEPAGSESAALEAARSFFRPELLNRIDDIVVLRQLTEPDVREIAARSLQALAAGIRERHGVDIRVEPDAVARVAAAGFSPAYGARELRRAIERLVEAPLAELVLSGELARRKAWRVTGEGSEIRIRPQPGSPAAPSA
jgi:ATP-dependent Clp protease ATP-binding subunit ClpC